MISTPELIFDGILTPVPHQYSRPVRAWRDNSVQITVMVTERYNDPGISITNSVGEWLTECRTRWPHANIRLIEHYPESATRYSEALLTDNIPHWHYLNTNDIETTYHLN